MCHSQPGKKMRVIVVLFFSLVTMSQSALPCNRRDFDSTSFVCVCNSTYCDEGDAIPLAPLPSGQVLQVTSDQLEFRILQRLLEFSLEDVPDPEVNRSILEVDRSRRFQSILGWGGSFTDSSGVTISKLSPSTQDKLMRSYFHNTGLDYSMGRLNMGGCDFSTRTYSHLDTPGDINLGTFQLQEEDTVYKIPYILQAQALREEPILLTASPWSAPIWMKSNNDFIGDGFLLPEYYQVWAEYFIRFMQEYEQLGVPFWGLTIQNEPSDGSIPDFPFNCMAWNATTQTTFIAENLGPAMEQAGYEDVKLMVLDDQRPLAPLWAREVFSDPLAYRYADGTGVHWYLDDSLDLVHALDMTHEEWPEKFILYTEACNGYVIGEEGVILGSWHRGERYLRNILQNLNHWVEGWIDWNLAVDMEGGPSWIGNRVDAPIIVNEELDEFYKQPMFYALGHVSRFMPRGSVRIRVQEEVESGLHFAAVERPDGSITVVVMNMDPELRSFVTLHDVDQGYLHLDIEPSSMHTFVYWP